MTDSGMPKRSSKTKKPAAFDPNTIASRIVDQATSEKPGEPEAMPDEPAKNPAAVALGRMGGLKGGAARAKSLSKKRRSAIARKAAKSRWKSGR